MSKHRNHNRRRKHTKTSKLAVKDLSQVTTSSNIFSSATTKVLAAGSAAVTFLGQIMPAAAVMNTGYDKTDGFGVLNEFIEFPVITPNTDGINITAAFSLIVDKLNVNPMFSAKYVPQVIYDLFATQTCAPIDPNGAATASVGYDFVTNAPEFYCSPSDDIPAGILSASLDCMVDPSCATSMTQPVIDCLNNVTQTACGILSDLQAKQDAKDHQTLAIAGGVAGAALLTIAGIFAYKRCKSRQQPSVDVERPATENTSLVNPTQ